MSRNENLSARLQARASDNLLLEMSEADYQTWRHSPPTKAFLAYLEDQAEVFRQELLARWENKALKEEDSNEIRGIVRILDELSNLPLSVIRRFYLGEEVIKEEEIEA
jgi:hypothetical protein